LLDTESDDEAPPPREEGHLYRVWYATTRKPVDADDPGQGYGGEIDPEERVHHGHCDVLIPKTHAFGSIGSPTWKRWLRPWRPDDRLHIESTIRLQEAAFLEAVREELREQPPEDRIALVYIHGYRTSFDDAAIRAAQIGFDLKIPGVTAFFSWHSRGDLDGYLADGEAIQEAEAPLRKFLLQFATEVDAEKVHLIAHSMGNQGLARVLHEIAEDVTEETGKPFAQILLAAPDISQRLFRRLADAYPKVSERTTLYISRKDKALWASRALQNTDRVGLTPPPTVLQNIDTVEVTHIDLTFLGHGYHGDAEPVLYDMGELIHNDTPPGRRQRIDPAPGPPPHWVIRA
jgi:esterase/lipase superfamily enzyme